MPGWYRYELAEFLFRMLDISEVLIKTMSRRAGVRKQLGFFLKQLGLVVTIPPIVVPAGLAMVHGKSLVRKLLRGVVNEVRCEPYRVWVFRHIRIMFGSRRRWRNAVNSNRACRDLAVHVPSIDPGQLLLPRDMCVLPGQWGLEQWPQVKQISFELRRQWRCWMQRIRLPGRVRGIGHQRLRSLIDQLHLPPQPAVWRQMEDQMSSVLAEAQGKILFADDRLADRIWAVAPEEAGVYMVSSALQDSTWSWCPNFSIDDVEMWQYTQARLGLPSCCHPLQPGRVPGRSIKHIFCLIKSKCFSAAGQWTCGKRAHSCWRRVQDASSCVGARGWQLMSKAVRHVVVTSKATQEVHCMKDVARALHELQEELSAPPSPACVRCGCPLHGQLQIVLADIDQAFEACEAKGILDDWAIIEGQAQACLAAAGQPDPPFIRVPRDERAVHFSQDGWQRHTVVFKWAELRQALVAWTLLSLVVLCGAVFRTDGIAIGGVMSSACVSVALGAAEFRWLSLNHHRRLSYPIGQYPVRSVISWRRYVDDLCAGSRRFCKSCLFQFVSGAFGMRLSAVSALEGSASDIGVWLDVSIYVHLQRIMFIPKNLNREWLFGDAPRVRKSILPWPGRPPGGFSRCLDVLRVRLTRSRELGMGPTVTAHWLLEAALEFFILAYPLSFIRALMHALPSCEGSRVARQVFRLWHHQQMSDKGRWGQQQRGGGNGGPSFRPKGSQAEGEQRRRRRPRRSSSSSSSGRERRAADKLEKARRLVEKSDPEFRAWKAESDERKEQEFLKKQSKVLSDVLADNLKGLTGQHTASGQPSSGTSGPTFPPTLPPASSAENSPEKMAEAMLAVLEKGGFIKAKEEAAPKEDPGTGVPRRRLPPKGSHGAADSEVLSKAQLGWMLSVLNPPSTKKPVVIHNPSFNAVVKVVEERLKDAAAAKNVKQFWNANLPDQAMPHRLDERAKEFVTFFQQ